MFFEKEMASRFVMMAPAAISVNCQNSSLAMEVIRRLKNTGECMEGKEVEGLSMAQGTTSRDLRNSILNDFDNKLIASGYGRERRRHIMLSGILGYER